MYIFTQSDFGFFVLDILPRLGIFQLQECQSNNKLATYGISLKFISFVSFSANCPVMRNMKY